MTEAVVVTPTDPMTVMRPLRRAKRCLMLNNARPIPELGRFRWRCSEESLRAIRQGLNDAYPPGTFDPDITILPFGIRAVIDPSARVFGDDIGRMEGLLGDTVISIPVYP